MSTGTNLTTLKDDKVYDLLNEIITKVDSTNDKLDDFENKTNTKLEEMLDAVKKNSENIKIINEKVEQIEEAAKTNEKKIKKVELKIAGYEGNTEQLKFEIEQLKSKELENDITIAGISKREGENLTEVLQKVCRTLKVNINDNEAVTYRTKGNENNPGFIVVKLKDLKKKYELLAAKRKIGNVFEEQLYNSENTGSVNNKQIFINHHITPYFNGILYQARQAKAQGIINAAWANSAGVYYKINEDDLPKRFQSINEIQQVLNSNNEQQSVTNTESIPDRTNKFASMPNRVNTFAGTRRNNGYQNNNNKKYGQRTQQNRYNMQSHGNTNYNNNYNNNTQYTRNTERNKRERSFDNIEESGYVNGRHLADRRQRRY